MSTITCDCGCKFDPERQYCHYLICGDCTDPAVIARLTREGKADCVFTSPPYAVGIDYGDYEDNIQNLREMLPKVSRLWLSVVCDGGFAVVNFGDIVSARSVVGTEEPCEYAMAVEYWPVFRGDGWLLWSRRIWCKPTARVPAMWTIQSNRASSDWEHIWTWRKSGDPIVKKVEGSLKGWFDSSRMEGVAVGKDEFGAGMPVGVADAMIKIHSRPGAMVHEPFTGTGTTIVSCERLARRGCGAELDPASVAVTLERLLGLGLTPRLVASVDDDGSGDDE